MKKITIAGIVTLIIVLTSGITYQIQSLNEKTGCRNGWEYVESGEFEGYFGCTTQSRVRYQVCFEVYDSANTKNYWCEKGKIVKVEDKKENSYSGKVWECPKRPNPCREVTI